CTATSKQDQGLACFHVKRQVAKDIVPPEVVGDVSKGDYRARRWSHGVEVEPSLTSHRFSAKGHSPSTHCASHTKPVRRAMPRISSTTYLWQASVQMVSPVCNVQVKPAARILTVCFCVERRCISMRRSSSLYRASCGKLRSVKSPPSSRLMRASRLRLNRSEERRVG